MATEPVVHSDKPAMTVVELVAFTKKELDADAERQAKLQAANLGELPRESQTGVTLDLSHKGINALPVEVISLIRDKVERLALSHNLQISVPAQIVQCNRLRYLNIRWNELTVFPEAVLQLHKLEILDVSKNSLTSIPEDVKKLTSLKFLAVARNRIKRLPLALGDMPSLSKLKFDDNPLEFPSAEQLEQLRPQQESSASGPEPEKRKDICQGVKRLLKAASLRERLKPSEEELSESNVETPRPPKRSATGGRFPIRPSVDIKFDSLENAPPIPQRSHARVGSTNASLLKRPGVAPLLTNGNDISRSRSETTSLSAGSLRQRRQGFVPSRKPMEDLSANTEVGDRMSQASTIKATHSRATSSASTLNGVLAAGSGDSSSSVASPVDGRFDYTRRLSSLPENRNSNIQTSDTIKGSRRLLFTLYQLERPITDVAVAVKDNTPRKSTLERKLFSAQAHVRELDRLLNRLEKGLEDGVKTDHDAIKTIVRVSVSALKAYCTVAAEMKRYTERIIDIADGIYVRCLMFQIHSAMVEARNICRILGFKVKGRPAQQSTPKPSQGWSSRNVTPTPPKPPENRRVRKPTILRSMTSNSTLRPMPPPPVPLSTNVSRTNTMTSIRSATPRSGESFSTMATSRTTMSRTNTMRSVMDEPDAEEQFGRIFLKLQATSNLASQALPHCRTEFQARKGQAQHAGQDRLAQQWARALSKCEEVLIHNKALKKRLEVVKVNDPGLRYQRDFWQLCDAFVQSWTNLATEVKDISAQRIDTTTVKQVMRNVQRHVKDVSKIISHSTLYHQALGAKDPNSAGSFGLAAAFPSGLGSAYSSTHTSIASSHSGYVTPVPATPLSAALGPAAQATMANTPTGPQLQREYFQEPVTSRPVTARERNDTPMQSQSYLRRYDTLR